MKMVKPLTERQQALLTLCDELFIEVGNMRTTGGEDTALYFAWVDEMECYPVEEQVQRFCAVTRACDEAGDFNYAYADFTDWDAAGLKTTENIGDDIFEEMPVMVVDLDTGERMNARLVVEWVPAVTRGR